MDIREIKPINFLFFRTETTVGELSNFLSIGQALFKEAVAHNLLITGPVHWHYFGFTGDAAKSFTLEIALPVSGAVQEYNGPFHVKRSDPFRCVSMMHEGCWQDMPQSYGKLMSFLAENKLVPSAVNREIYVNADFVHPEANVTEIQVGVQ